MLFLCPHPHTVDVDVTKGLHTPSSCCDSYTLTCIVHAMAIVRPKIACKKPDSTVVNHLSCIDNPALRSDTEYLKTQTYTHMLGTLGYLRQHLPWTARGRRTLIVRVLGAEELTRGKSLCGRCRYQNARFLCLVCGCC